MVTDKTIKTDLWPLFDEEKTCTCGQNLTEITTGVYICLQPGNECMRVWVSTRYWITSYRAEQSTPREPYA